MSRCCRGRREATEIEAIENLRPLRARTPCDGVIRVNRSQIVCCRESKFNREDDSVRSFNEGTSRWRLQMRIESNGRNDSQRQFVRGSIALTKCVKVIQYLVCLIARDTKTAAIPAKIGDSQRPSLFIQVKGPIIPPARSNAQWLKTI